MRAVVRFGAHAPVKLNASEVYAQIGDDVVCRLSPGTHELTITHKGPPPNWTKNLPWTEGHGRLYSVVVYDDDNRIPMGYALNGARQLEDGGWEIINEERDLYGGERLHVEMVDYSEKIPLDLHGMPFALADGVELDQDALKNLSDVLYLWGAHPGELDIRHNPRTLLWRMNPAGWDHIGGNPDDIYGWRDAGDLYWADNHTNCHYNAELWPMLWALLNPTHPDAQLSARVGLWMLKQKCGFGLYWSSNNKYEGHWAYEKSTKRRRGDVFLPSNFKQWDLGLIVGHLLEPANQHLRDALFRRRSYWLTRPTTKQGIRSMIGSGRYGSRNVARPLSNLLYWWRFDVFNRNLYERLASGIIEEAMSWVSAENPWFRDVETWNGPFKYWAPWMQAQAIHAVDAWLPILGLREEHGEKMALMCEKALSFVELYGDGYARVPLYINGYPEWTVYKWGHPSLCAWMTMVLPVAENFGVEVSPAMRDALVKTGYAKLGCNSSNIHDSPRLSLAGGDLGGAGGKILAGAMSSLLR
jgi:hypothetical protein